MPHGTSVPWMLKGGSDSSMRYLPSGLSGWPPAIERRSAPYSRMCSWRRADGREDRIDPGIRLDQLAVAEVVIPRDLEEGLPRPDAVCAEPADHRVVGCGRGAIGRDRLARERALVERGRSRQRADPPDAGATGEQHDDHQAGRAPRPHHPRASGRRIPFASMIAGAALSNGAAHMPCTRSGRTLYMIRTSPGWRKG